MQKQIMQILFTNQIKYIILYTFSRKFRLKKKRSLFFLSKHQDKKKKVKYDESFISIQIYELYKQR